VNADDLHPYVVLRNKTIRERGIGENMPKDPEEIKYVDLQLSQPADQR